MQLRAKFWYQRVAGARRGAPFPAAVEMQAPRAWAPLLIALRVDPRLATGLTKNATSYSIQIAEAVAPVPEILAAEVFDGLCALYRVDL